MWCRQINSSLTMLSDTDHAPGGITEASGKGLVWSLPPTSPFLRADRAPLVPWRFIHRRHKAGPPSGRSALISIRQAASTEQISADHPLQPCHICRSGISTPGQHHGRRHNQENLHQRALRLHFSGFRWRCGCLLRLPCRSTQQRP